MPRINVGDFADDRFDQPHGRSRADTRRRRRASDWDVTVDDPDVPATATRSTYQESRGSQGPRPAPAWLVTSSAALDHQRATIKTGKEADVDLVERVDPPTRCGRACWPPSAIARAEHRLFHRDAGYLEGRRVRRSRENRAMADAHRRSAGRSSPGSGRAAEFETLGTLWSAGVAVPYPVQIGETELLMEFIGDPDGTAAPRLAELRPDLNTLDDLWVQCRTALESLAGSGYAHGDLSAYNVLVHDGRLVLIDLPQVVDIVGNPQGASYLRRDCDNICRWFTANGHPDADAAELSATLASEAGIS